MSFYLSSCLFASDDTMMNHQTINIRFRCCCCCCCFPSGIGGQFKLPTVEICLYATLQPLFHNCYTEPQPGNRHRVLVWSQTEGKNTLKYRQDIEKPARFFRISQQVWQWRQDKESVRVWIQLVLLFAPTETLVSWAETWLTEEMILTKMQRAVGINAAVGIKKNLQPIGLTRKSTTRKQTNSGWPRCCLGDSRVRLKRKKKKKCNKLPSSHGLLAALRAN